MNHAKTTDEYISSFPADVQNILHNIRARIKSVVPEAEEAMKYGIPTFVFEKKNLLHFGAYKQHIGFYPTPDVIIAFQKELSDFKTAKGSIQFPLSQPIPFHLIEQMTEYRVARLRDDIPTKKKKQ